MLKGISYICYSCKYFNRFKVVCELQQNIFYAVTDSGVCGKYTPIKTDVSEVSW